MQKVFYDLKPQIINVSNCEEKKYASILTYTVLFFGSHDCGFAKYQALLQAWTVIS